MGSLSLGAAIFLVTRGALPIPSIRRYEGVPYLSVVGIPTRIPSGLVYPTLDGGGIWLVRLLLLAGSWHILSFSLYTAILEDPTTIGVFPFDLVVGSGASNLLPPPWLAPSYARLFLFSKAPFGSGIN